ncbi:equilibrative nucleoside transporter 2 [Ischnura elegans]|uniref:equilibrative nucleoside transporter 2 n=1 Tax=Ischnura elegans TaxID=197161 RepID=UPI001ED86AAA|nr:equilibrative nucleoside transporter 2 [Ischnura elegans]
MEYSVNTRPLLQESESEVEDTGGTSPMEDNADSHVVVTNMAKPILKLREPSDRYHLAYTVFYLLGMTTLLPWNFFITAEDYWMFKLRDTSANYTLESKTKLQTEFTAYLSMASTIPNTLFLVISSFIAHKLPLQIRMHGSLVIILVLFVITTALVKVDSDSWQTAFFALTLCTVVILNAASAILQGSLFGVLGKFAPRFITAAVAGQALGGIFAALAEIFSLSLSVPATTSAFIYFVVAIVMLILSIVGYCLLSETLFFKFHMEDKRDLDNLSCDSSSIQEVVEPSSRNISYKSIMSKIWVYSYSLWMVFFVSLAAYPAITVLIVSTSHGKSTSAWNNVYFVPVIGYLLFSTFDYAGRILSGWLIWPREKGWLVALLSTARIVFIPLLLLCNAQPRNNLPVLIDSDIAYIAIMILFALSNGYLANISLVLVPRCVDASEQEAAASLMAGFLGIGLSCGSFLSILLVKIL